MVRLVKGEVLSERENGSDSGLYLMPVRRAEYIIGTIMKMITELESIRH